MVPPSKKRKLRPAAEPPSKRQRSPARPPKSRATKAHAARRAVDPASLAWTQVGEEFGALEVIEGVDVVKHGDTVRFLVTGQETADLGQDEQEETFEGFGDNAVEVEDVNTDKASRRKPAVASQETSKKAQAKEKEKDKQKSGRKAATEDDQLAAPKEGVQKSSSHGNSFLALAGMAEAEEEADEVDVAAWVSLNLSPPILSAIAKLNFPNPTAIQEKAIPEIMAGEDVIGKAQTGSGKTLAFGIPIVEKWLEMQDDPEAADRDGPMAVVLSPTRELAKQLGDHLKALCDGLPSAPFVCVVTGGLSIHKQQRQLEKADIVIGTPGRLWEVLEGDVKLQDQFVKIRFLVVDEADRLFKAGQFKEAEDIIGALDKKDPEAGDEEDTDDDEEDGQPRQTLVFSATFDKNLQTKLAGRGRFSAARSDGDEMEYLMKCLKFRSEPKFIDVNPVSQMADGLREGLVECGAMEKDLYVYTVLLLNPGRRTLIFTNSISAVRRLTPLLQNLNLAALPLHSQMPQKARLRSLERFTAASSSVLVATDVAARGLDIKAVDQILHYHVPRSADTYIHRSGRTARGDRSGVSIILCAPDEVIPTRRLAGKVHAKRQASGSKRRDSVIQTLPLDRKIAARLRPRVDIAKRLADAVLAKEKAHSDDTWLRGAAEELGVDYDSDEFEAAGDAMGWGGRGGGRKKKEKEARSLSKAEMGALRAQLREELSHRVNLGVSERYITGGRVNVAALLKEREQGVEGVFLGGDGLELGFDP